MSEYVRSIYNLQKEGQNFPYILYTFASAPHLSILQESLDKLQRLAHDNNFTVAIAVIPFLGRETSNEYSSMAAHQIIHHVAKRHGLQTISVLDAFREYGIQGLKLSPLDDLHPNAIGHELIAETIFQELDLAGTAHEERGSHNWRSETK